MSVGKDACKVCEGSQASANGNHDNQVSGNHPDTITLNTQWKIRYLQYSPRGRGDGSKAFCVTVHTAQQEQNG